MTMIETPKQENQFSQWRDAPAMLDVFKDDVDDIVAFINGCTTDDLHVFTTVHGVEAERRIFSAILQHPLLDRATALEIFHVCNPAFYENELARGADETMLAVDDEDAVFLDILQMAYDRLTKGQKLSSKLAAPCLTEWMRFPHVCPTGFKRWPLQKAHVAPTEARMPNPSIVYDYSKIKLSYDLWQRRH